MPDFATPPKIIHRAFERIAGTLHVEGFWARFKLQAAVSAAFREAHRAGDSRRACMDIAAILVGRDWRWPFFEKAEAEFRARDVWPVAWGKDGVTPISSWETTAAEKRIALLVMTLDAACYADRDRETHMAAARSKSLLPGWKQFLKPAFASCAVERLMIERHSYAIERRQEGAILPPYFPGDAMGLELHIPRRRGR